MEVVEIPKDFDDCVKIGGKVKKKLLKNDRYICICYDKQGKSYADKIRNNKDTNVEVETKKVPNEGALMDSLIKLKEHFNRR